MITITADELDQIIDQADLDEDAIRREYNGRGMFGDACLGITCRTAAEILRFAIALSDVLGSERAEMIVNKTREDSMGRGAITYFPGVTVED